MDKRWSVWLCPDSISQLATQQLVNDCCGQFNLPVFEPHITLFGRVETDPVPTFTFFEKLVRVFEPITLNVLGIKKGILPWKAIYLQMEKSDQLVLLQNKVNLYLNGYRCYEFDPHVSLAYGNLDINETELSSISFPETITFSSVALGTTPDEITDWKIINRLNLREGASL